MKINSLKIWSVTEAKMPIINEFIKNHKIKTVEIEIDDPSVVNKYMSSDELDDLSIICSTVEDAIYLP